MLKRILAITLCLVMLTLFVACKGGDDPAATTAATTEEATTATTAANEAKEPTLEDYLSTLEYHDFELTGSNEPYFMGRWFEKEIDGVSHMVTVTDGSLFYFLTDKACISGAPRTPREPSGNTSL